MTNTRAPRPTDLVALVTFGEEVRENMAVTRDHLGVPHGTPRPIAAAIEQWLHLGRRTWISVAGREIRGIATARDLASKSAWEIDTLVDAPAPTDGPDAEVEVVVDLLRQAARAARDAQVTHLLLRTPIDSVASRVAVRAGFRRVVDEQLWVGRLTPASPVRSDTAGHVREAAAADTVARFQVFSRAYPVAAREALAMMQEEWRAVQDDRWVDRGGLSLVQEADGRVHGTLEASARGQFRLTVAAGAATSGLELLAELGRRLSGTPDHFTLVPQGSAAEEAVQAAGLVPAGEYSLFCQRFARPVRDDVRAPARIAVTG